MCNSVPSAPFPRGTGTCRGGSRWSGRWRPDADGNITVKTAFWPEDRPFKRQVPWLLVYADLMAVDDSRSQEIASEFKAKHMEV
ncbi:MAG: hypothetical protein IJJ33_13735 [Victivallales bacterium]|nr:hypothetical protein [Victivallales bacterium]